MDFASGLDLIIVVEEKRSLIEVQVREELYGTANQPICIGKKDEQGNWLFPVKGALDPNDVAICIGERILRHVGALHCLGRWSEGRSSVLHRALRRDDGRKARQGRRQAARVPGTSLPGESAVERAASGDPRPRPSPPPR